MCVSMIYFERLKQCICRRIPMSRGEKELKNTQSPYLFLEGSSRLYTGPSLNGLELDYTKWLLLYESIKCNTEKIYSRLYYKYSFNFL